MLLPDVVAILKPCACPICDKRFADTAGLKVHQDTMHGTRSSTLVDPKQSLKTLSVDQLKRLLREKGLSGSRKKSILLTRLENAVAGDS
jgi:hypothetical protein